jgi:hypothetical protein
MTWQSIEQIKEANARTGQHWFDPSTLRFFNSRIGSTIYGGRYFVTSEQGPSMPRMWSVREAAPDGTISTCFEFNEFPSREAAVRAAQSLTRSN